MSEIKTRIFMKKQAIKRLRAHSIANHEKRYKITYNNVKLNFNKMSLRGII